LSDNRDLKLIVLTPSDADTCDDNLAKLIDFAGVPCHRITAGGSAGLLDQLSSDDAGHDICLMINARCLLELSPHPDALDAFTSFATATIPNVLVYNVRSHGELNPVLERFTGGAVRSARPLDAGINTVVVADDGDGMCRPFSGLSFDCRNNGFNFALTLEEAARHVDTLVAIDGAPHFIRLQRDQCRLHILASGDIVDLDQTIDENWSYKTHFSQFVPLLMFIRHVFGDRCWRGNRPFASFIIDDPLLRPQYGFLDYRMLLQATAASNFHASVAFIPYNFRRSDPGLAHDLRDQPDTITLCVHGCNHTDYEFGTTDVPRLVRLTEQAMDRMVVHEQLTGMAFDTVMVFPKGLFSSRAMEVLKAKGFLAAVNTSPLCVDKTGNIRVADVLDVAIMDYACFPLFVRRYPHDVVDFAFDLFLGKPAFIVEHHDYFQSGYESLSEFVDAIGRLEHGVTWAGLQDVIEHCYSERIRPDGTREVRIYGGRCAIDNSTDRLRTCAVTKRESGPVPIRRVTVDGVDVPHAVTDGTLTVSTEIPPMGSVRLVIDYEDCHPETGDTDTWYERGRIWTRRRLSEFRDNRVSKSALLSQLAKKLRGRR
jgi:hypothetical protein